MIKNKISRYETDEGFDEPQIQSEVVLDLPAYDANSHSVPFKVERKRRSYTRKQEPKLKFVSIDRDNSTSSQYQYSNSKFDRQKVNKSMTLTRPEQYHRQQNSLVKKRAAQPILPSKSQPVSFQSFKAAIVKPARVQVGENLQLKDYDLGKKQELKQAALKKGNQIVFEEERQENSHAYFKKLLKLQGAESFLKSKYNKALYNKVLDSCVTPKTEGQSKPQSKNSLHFCSDFECANLDFATKVNHYEYDLFLKADTSSLGHQNWFYFKVFHNREKTSSLFFNVCNLKRAFRMVKKGQKPYFRFRKLGSFLETGIEEVKWSEWDHVSGDVSVAINQELSKLSNGKQKRVYKLSFSMELIANSEYQISLLPPFSYSDMLSELQKLQQKSDHMAVQILGYSLIGMAIPLVTFTDPKTDDRNKSVTLISSRIHPGETCGSFVASGILKKLAEKTEEVESFLANNIVKIVPMINPDGVVMGNFRTNYLGSDLNRSFNRNDETLFPEVMALKTYGEKILKTYKDRFMCFLDLHGHSSQKNIFTYGPQFESSHKNYLSSRLLPKVLDHLCDCFDYESCTFKLQQSKISTARGYFLGQLKVIAFTVESSYALYDSKKETKQKNLHLKPQNWRSFGASVVESIEVWSQNCTANGVSSEKKQTAKNSAQVLKQLSEQKEKSSKSKFNFLSKIKKELRKESLLPPKLKKKSKTESDEESISEQSDGQSESEDLPLAFRLKLEKKIIEGTGGSMFPKILRPAIVHPQVNPPLFTVNKISPEHKVPQQLCSSSLGTAEKKGSSLNMKYKRHRHNTIKPMNVNSAYTEYLMKEVKGLQSLRPNVNLMKLERKDSLYMQQPNSSAF